MPLDTSVIIVSYNTWDLLAGCLRSVFSSKNVGQLEVLVVDNASSDGSPDLAQERFPQVGLVKNSENKGFAAAANQALREAKGEYLLLLNPDTEVGAEAIATLREFLEKNPRTGLVGPQLLFPNGRFQHSAFSFPNLFMVFFDFFAIHGRLLDSRLNGRYPRGLYEREEPFPIDHPLGAAMMVRREVLDQVGLLDEGFFMYCEEIDWCMRMKRAGWGVFCQPRARVVHHGAQATQKNWGPMYMELHRSRYRLYEKHYSPLFRKLARLLVGLGIRRGMAQAKQAASRGSISAEELEKRLATYRQVLGLS